MYWFKSNELLPVAKLKGTLVRLRLNRNFQGHNLPKLLRIIFSQNLENILEKYSITYVKALQE